MSLLEHLDDLRRAYAGQDGLALLRALLKEGPLAGRTALVSSFGAESAVLLDMVATVDPATPVIFLDTGKLFAETQAYREELVELLRLARRARGTAARRRRLRATTRAATLWRREPDLCCHIRKTEPLQEALDGLRGLDHRAQALPGRAAQPAADHRAGVVDRADQAQSAGAVVGRGRRALPAAAQSAQASAGRPGLPLDRLHHLHPAGDVGRGAARGPLVGPRQDRMRDSPGGRGGVRARSSLPEFAPGSVWLVGAGPGDPGLLTLHAAHALACADVVLHDALVAPEILALAGPAAASSRSASAPAGRGRRSSGSTSA